jgi:hypothetical protein
MSLDQFQKALLELYTKPAVMETFFQDPEHFFSAFELTDREKSSLLELPRKNLKQFQRDLAGKRVRVAAKVLNRAPNSIVVAPFSKTGSAVISWGTPVQSSSISPGMFLLLMKIATMNIPINMRALLSAYASVQPQCSPKDIFLLARLVYSKRLIGKTISAPS